MAKDDITSRVSGEIKELVEHAGDTISMQWKAGETIIEKGKTGNYMYLVAAGEAAIRVGGEILEVVGPSGIIGEMALIDSPTRSATVLAQSDVTLIPIDKWKFRYLTQRHPDFALYIMGIMSTRIRMMNMRLGDDD